MQKPVEFANIGREPFRLFLPAMVLVFAAQKIFLGDILFLLWLVIFLGLMISRFKVRKDTPPPGFVLVGLAFLCVLAGAVISLFEPWMESPAHIGSPCRGG